MIVDKITLQDRVAVKKSLARAEVCNFDGIWNFSQEVVSWRYWSLPGDDKNELLDILRNFEGYFSHFITCHFGLSPFLAKPLNE